MPTRQLAGYALEALREDEEFVTLRGSADGDRGPVLAIAPALEHPAPETIDRLRHAFSLRDEIDSAWASRPLALADLDGRPTLILSDPGGEFLDRLQPAPLGLSAFLRVACGLARSLDQLHARGLVHRNIKPANVLADVATGRTWLTGFGIASRASRGRRPSEAQEAIEGTLAYMAPEQTGRMNRSIDARSDLYALGVTLYELLTGTLPLVGADPLDWVHAHLARPPTPPGERVSGIPEPIGAIVMRLLAKNPEERYQAAAGVEADLRRCLEEWDVRGRIERFPLGSDDVRDRLQIPEKLYGREVEVERLLRAFERVVASGAPELVLVAGSSGVGKSSVVNELQKALVPRRGMFASGKLDRQRCDVPHAPLARALQVPVHVILGRSQEKLGRWREAIRHALGPNGRLVVSLLPELELIVGPQPPVADLPPQDAMERFRLVLRRFIAAIARPEHPLALFLDDLQWLDAASLDFLEHLATHPDTSHVLLVGAYREDEVGPGHPLRSALERIRSAGARVSEIALAPLGLSDLVHFVSDALHASVERARPLAELLHERTCGNPFFAIQFLEALHDKGLVVFDPAMRAWTWDLDRMRAEGFTDNVADLMLDRLRRLPEATRRALRVLASLGDRADADDLAASLDGSAADLDSALAEGVVAGLIRRHQDQVAFLHDRIREASYALVPEGERAAEHLRIGRILAARLVPGRRGEKIFDVVSQLDRGASLIESRDERDRTAALQLEAGRRARAATGYATALRHFTSGAAMLALDRWERRFDLAFDLEVSSAECEFQVGAHAAAEERLLALSARAARPVDRSRVVCAQARLYLNTARVDRAVVVCLEYLRGAGLPWPLHPTDAAVRLAHERVQERLDGRPIEALSDLPRMSDPDCRATMSVLAELTSPAYFVDRGLFALVVLHMTDLSLEHGNGDGSCLAYALLGLFLGPRFGGYEEGLRFGEVAMALVERPGLDRYRARVYVSFGNTVIPWTRHLRAGEAVNRRALEVALEAGDLTYAGFSRYLLVTNLLGCGVPLAEVEREAESGLAAARRERFAQVVAYISAQLGLVRSLMGSTTRFGALEVVGFEERALEEQLRENPALSVAACWYWVRKLQARFHAGEHDAALDAAERARALLQAPSSFFEESELYLHVALSLAASAGAGARIDEVKAHHERFARWAESCRENFAHRAALLAAEVARLESRTLDAERLYEDAVRLAREHGFVHDEALAGEIAGRFHAERGLETIARAYLRNARSGYLCWGALGKVRWMDRHYPALRDDRTPRAPPDKLDARAHQLDLASVVKALQAVSSEIILDELVEVLLRTAVQNAGATRGVLALVRDGAPRIEAEAASDRERVVVTRAEKSGEAAPERFPETLLRTVVRTQDRVLLDDATATGDFADDPYIRSRRPRSILCLPIICQGKLVGALYLENDLAARAFTPDRLAVLELLASQAAISLENARLFRDLDEENRGRRRAEEELHKSEDRFRLAIDTIPGLVWTAEPDGYCDFLNKRKLDYTGMTLDEARGWGWQEAVCPEDRPSLLGVWRTLLATGMPGETEARLRRFDGVYRWFLYRAVPILDERGNVMKWYGTTTDIEDRKRAESLLAGEKRLLELMAKGKPLPVTLDAVCRLVEELAPGSRCSIFLLDRSDGRMRHGAAPSLPATYRETFDGTPVDPAPGPCALASCTGERVFVGDIAAEMRWPLFRDLALANGLRACWSWPIVSSEGRTLGAFALYSIEPGAPTARHESLVAQVVHLASIAIERDQAEGALRRSEAILAKAQRLSSTGSFSWRPSGESGLSEEALRICELDPSVPITGEMIRDRMHPEDVPPFRQMLSGGGGDFSFDCRLLMPDGRIKHLQVVASASRDDSGRLLEWTGAVRDVTDLKKSEDALHKLRADLAHVNRVATLGELTASIAHEVNQPLAAVVMNGNACIRWLARTPPELMEAREAANRIVRDASRAGEVIARLRELFKKSGAAKVPLDLNHVIRDVIALTRRELQKHAVSVRTEFVGGLPTVAGDRVQLQQVVLNLIMNALEAMSGVRERPREMTISTRMAEEGRVEISVKDTGVGLDSKAFERVFEAFHTTKADGMGMGLSISRSIVENHGGRIWAEAHDGPGVTFRFFVPRQP